MLSTQRQTFQKFTKKLTSIKHFRFFCTNTPNQQSLQKQSFDDRFKEAFRTGNLSSLGLLFIPPIILAWAFLNKKSNDQNGLNSNAEPGLRIYIVRHAESEGNVDLSAYAKHGDHRVPLTQDGEEMAVQAGQFLNKYFEIKYGSVRKKPKIHMWVSPYERTRGTAIGLLKGGLGHWINEVFENVNLVEQDWGLFEGKNISANKIYEKFPDAVERTQNQKETKGRFWARFPQGESVLDVYDRIDSWLDVVFRSGVKDHVVVTHGITGRALIMRLFHYSPEWFEDSVNLPNCSVYYINTTSTSNTPSDQQFVFGGFGSVGLENKLGLKKLNDQNMKCIEAAEKEKWKYERYLYPLRKKLNVQENKDEENS